VGPTTCYSLMQAVGMVNDHQPGCFRAAKAPRRRVSGR
jgi:DNA-3-methyladenine glycosylase I